MVGLRSQGSLVPPYDSLVPPRFCLYSEYPLR
jgi:hypothetical protein